MKTRIRLSDHFTYRKLLRFVAPSVAMMIISSIYGIVDGFFVSNYVGKTEFAALNFIMPAVMILGGLGFIIGTGGSALVAKKLGEGDVRGANGVFSMLVWVTILGGLVLSALGALFIRPIAFLIGATPDIIDHCVVYARWLFAGNTAFMLQNVFSSFLVVAERPRMGLIVSISSGLTNMLLDFVLVGLFRTGLPGAALASDAGQIVGGVIPLVFFACRNSKSPLHLGRFRFSARELFAAVSNGFSEFVTNISVSVVGMVYNAQLLRYAGEDGVSAYGVLMYVNFVFTGFFFGYSVGASPVVSYHYGAKNHGELRRLLGKSLVITALGGALMTLLAETLAEPLSRIFVSYDETLLQMTVHALRLYAACFLLFGFNIFASSFFTALNNGLLSALISVCRTFLFQIAAVLLLPLALGLDGIWLAITAAEGVAFFLCAALLAANAKKYGYAPPREKRGANAK